MRRFLRWTKIALTWLLFVVVPPALTVAGFFGSAKLTASLAGLIVGALVSGGLGAVLTSWLAVRTSRITKRRPWVTGLSVAMMALVSGIAGRVLFVRPAYEIKPMPARIVAFDKTRVSTGSNLAIARIPAAQPAARTSPLVFLHGGPGAYVRDSELEMLRSLATQGIEVVTFDQAGGGESERLGVREYSLARAVADLEAVREHIGAERISIMGQSWGSMLAFEYAVAHPDRVDHLVLTGAGLLTAANNKFTLERTAAAKLGPPSFPAYFFTAAMLHKVNPDAAVAFLPREELDATWRRAAAGNIARWYCASDAESVPSPQAMLDMPAFDGYQGLALKGEMEKRTAPPSPPSTLPPSLMLRGECDFIPWGAARDMRDALHATLVTIPGVGHAIWPKKSDVVRDLVAAHLKGQPLNAQAYEGSDEPPLASLER